MIPVAFVLNAFRRFQTPPASDFSQVMDFSINAHLKILFGVLRWGCIIKIHFVYSHARSERQTCCARVRFCILLGGPLSGMLDFWPGVWGRQGRINWVRVPVLCVVCKVWLSMCAGF